MGENLPKAEEFKYSSINFGGQSTTTETGSINYPSSV